MSEWRRRRADSYGRRYDRYELKATLMSGSVTGTNLDFVAAGRLVDMLGLKTVDAVRLGDSYGSIAPIKGDGVRRNPTRNCHKTINRITGVRCQYCGLLTTEQ